jgi:hypothetical protein
MLVFVAPLQSPRASKHWPNVCKLAKRTVHSILDQTHPDFRLLLVCNEPPPGLPMHPKLTVVQRDLPVPDMSIWENRMVDKWRKVRIGLVATRTFTPCHVMITDADDLVSNRLAEVCAANPNCGGWVFASSWMYDENSRWILHRRNGFNSVCGTSSIVRVELSDLPAIEEGSLDETLILRSGHTQIEKAMSERGTPLTALPFDGAIYILGTGENHTNFSLAKWRSKKILIHKLLNYRPLTSRIRREFGLQPLSSL